MKERESTRDRLLLAAQSLFAAHGYEGASVQAITAAARVNRRMIYHYFGDKRGLYAAVFRSCWQGLAQALAKVGEDGSLEDALGALFDFLAENPSFARLMMWEGLEGGALSRELWSDTSGPMFRAIEEKIREEQGRGLLDPALHPGHFVISFLGAVCHYFAYAGSLGDLIDADPLSPEALEERRRQLLKLLDAMISRP